jgi:putative sigma-54 modulation protein
MLSAVNVQARGVEIKPEIRAHFEEKLHSLEKVWSRLDDAQIRIKHERGHYVAEVTLFAAGVMTRAEERNHDLRAAFDAALHKLQAQLKRYKDKVQHKSRRQNNRDDVNGVVMHPKVVGAANTVESATISPLTMPRTGVETAITDSKPSDDGELSAADESPATLVRTKRFAIKPMSPDEAALQMDLLGHDFFVFRNCRDNGVEVVYRRSGGGYGLIEPISD